MKLRIRKVQKEKKTKYLVEEKFMWFFWVDTKLFKKEKKAKKFVKNAIKLSVKNQTLGPR